MFCNMCQAELKEPDGESLVAGATQLATLNESADRAMDSDEVACAHVACISDRGNYRDLAGNMYLYLVNYPHDHCSACLQVAAVDAENSAPDDDLASDLFKDGALRNTQN